LVSSPARSSWDTKITVSGVIEDSAPLSPGPRAQLSFQRLAFPHDSLYRLPLQLPLRLSGYTRSPSSIPSRTNLSGPCAVPGAQSVGKHITGATFKRTKYFAERDITVRLYHKFHPNTKENAGSTKRSESLVWPLVTASES
jgi:hypothetical protein